MQVQRQQQYYSPTEYLELEEKADCRHDYRDGKIVEMTGGSFNHNQISLNLALSLRLALREQNYQICMADMRLWIPRYSQYTYPDVMVIAGEPVFQADRNDTLTNPSIILEVLSKSTSTYDRGDKFTYYRSIPELQDYVLLDHYRFHVEQFSKTAEGKWLLTDYELENDELELTTIALQIPLKEIYERVKFESPETQS
ncbi:MAG: Uma2 family endonuclease [Cyanobacteria bacterium CRU_2_1]|nr:Uma2 family endonuclease [Cyanobacteria bacterium RU_5_0]NJR60227.1 Uma2 family endonuclease [Cyanobacteria bacterium CRU_2_1]